MNILYKGNRHGKTLEQATRLVKLAHEINGETLNIKVTSVEYDKLREIMLAACDLIDNHDEIQGETCRSCGENGDTTHGEVLATLIDEYRTKLDRC